MISDADGQRARHVPRRWMGHRVVARFHTRRGVGQLRSRRSASTGSTALGRRSSRCRRDGSRAAITIRRGCGTGRWLVDDVELPLDGGAAGYLDFERANEWREDYLATVGIRVDSPDGSLSRVRRRQRSVAEWFKARTGRRRSVTLLTVERGTSLGVIGFSPEGDRILFSRRRGRRRDRRSAVEHRGRRVRRPPRRRRDGGWGLVRAPVASETRLCRELPSDNASNGQRRPTELGTTASLYPCSSPRRSPNSPTPASPGCWPACPRPTGSRSWSSRSGTARSRTWPRRPSSTPGGSRSSSPNRSCRSARWSPFGAKRRPGRSIRFIWLTEGVTFRTPREVLRFLYLHEWMHWYLHRHHGRGMSAETTCDRFALRNYRKKEVTVADARSAMRRQPTA